MANPAYIIMEQSSGISYIISELYETNDLQTSKHFINKFIDIVFCIILVNLI